MNTSTMNKSISLFASTLGLMVLLTACSSSDDAAQVIADEFVQINGNVMNLADAGEPDVQVEAVYTDPGNPLNPVTTTGSDGGFALQLLKDTPAFLRATKSNFTTINSAKAPFTASMDVGDIGMPTETQAQEVIDAAFSAAATLPVLQNHAWLVVDVVDAAGNEVDGREINIPSASPPADEVYTNCDGSDSGQSMTVAPCPADRPGPMFIAYFDVEGEVEITVGGQKQLAPIRMGEVTALEFEVAANEFFAISGNITASDGSPLQAISVEAVYTVPGDLANPTTTTSASGLYSVEVLKSKPVYLRMTGSGFAAVNTAKVELAVADLTGVNIMLPTPGEAQTAISTAGFTDLLADKSWLMVGVYDGSGAEREGLTITSSVTPDAEVYTDCDGLDSNGSVTTKCVPNRAGPMYIGSFSSTTDATVQVGSETQIAPLRLGEITHLEF